MTPAAATEGFQPGRGAGAEVRSRVSGLGPLVPVASGWSAVAESTPFGWCQVERAWVFFPFLPNSGSFRLVR